MNPHHFNSPQPIPPLFLLPLSSFATNSSSIFQTVLEAEIGPILASTTFHYSQKLNTWWPPLSSRFPHQVMTSFLSLRKSLFFFAANCLKCCGFAISISITISIRANHDAPCRGCILIWALMNFIFVWFCHHLCDCIDQVNMSCNSVGNVSWFDCQTFMSRMSSQLQSKDAYSYWQRLAGTGPRASVVGMGSAFYFVPNCVLASWKSSHSSHRAWTQSGSY